MKFLQCISRRPVVLLLSASLLGLAGCSKKSPGSAKAEWPEFRGPTQDGHSTATDLPVEWSPEKNIIWKTDLPGRSWSSPIVAKGKVYLTNAVAAKDDNNLSDKVSLRVLSLDAATGALLWDKEMFSIDAPQSFGVHEKNSHASPTAVYDEGHVYVHYGHFGSACVDELGNIVWKTTEPAYKSEHGNGACPVIFQDLLILNCDGQEEPFVAALDKRDGKLRWKTVRGRKGKNLYALCTPLLIEVGGQQELITVGTRIVQALDPKNGKELWHVYHEEYCAVPRPVFSNGLVFISTGFEQATAMAIRPEAKGVPSDQRVVWTTNKQVPKTPSMVAVGADLYMVSDTGVVTCLDAKTGTVHWQERVGKMTSASLLYADGKIYMQDEFGKGYVLKPGPKLEILATNDLKDKSLASYAVSGQHLLIRTQHALWCVGEKK